MKIKLPNGQKTILDDSLTIEEKKEVVFRMTEEWDSLIIENWGSTTIIYFLDSLSNYLNWHKEQIVNEEGGIETDSSEDKEVMSKNKTNRLYRGRRDNVFSSLSDRDTEMLFGERGSE